MEPKLYEAATNGEIEPFNGIAKDNLRSIVTHNNKHTVLHVNIARQSLKNKEGESVSTKFVEQILEICPSLLIQANAKGDSPLHAAAKCGRPAVVKVLIEFAKKQPTAMKCCAKTVWQMLGLTNEEENTALHEAVQCGNLDAVKILMEAGPNFPYSANVNGETPLYMAAARGSKKMVAEILEKCSSAAHDGPNGKTALHAAVNSYAADVVEKLLAKKRHLTRERDDCGWTPLHHSAYLGLKDITALLLEFDGSSALILDKDRKMTALLMAASQGHESLAGTIIAHYPECYDLVDNGGWNVLHFLMVSLHESKLKRLLKDPLYKSFIDEKNEMGNTPLHILATLSARTCNEIVRQIGKGDTQAVNKKKKSVKHIELYGCPELQGEIQGLSENIGRGQYPKGVVKLGQDKSHSFVKFLDEEVTGMENASVSHLVVAALTATVTFAAALTLLGGNKGDNEDGPNRGTAIFAKNAAFQAFIISDAIAMNNVVMDPVLYEAAAVKLNLLPLRQEILPSQLV
ncbi:ANK REP REGION domain-containing protein [Citrus sinensis]|uniref:ANK REP REGION domain-containing protein n=1 Tax=Citrus sinensis TaxID=2711 RepID=A0ACB8I572_CITSI|nr:ANK REP REGION domain-containing protein [Citrus sinensis]